MLICASRRLRAPVARAFRCCLFHKVVKKCNVRIRRAIGIRLPNSAEWWRVYVGSDSWVERGVCAACRRRSQPCSLRWRHALAIPAVEGGKSALTRRRARSVRSAPRRPELSRGQAASGGGGKEMQMRGVRAHSSRAATGSRRRSGRPKRFAV